MLAIAIVFIPITVIGIFGNILVLLVIALNTQMHDRLAKKNFFLIFKKIIFFKFKVLLYLFPIWH